MADVVVVGAGLGGLATAARLAKLGHRVVVCERGDSPGGLLGRISCGGFEWDSTPMQTTLPAVLRDLFRKSGRPLERYVDLALSTPARRHVFADGTVLDLPTGSRGGQLQAIGEALGPKPAEAWTDFVDGQVPVWKALRSLVLDLPDGPSRLGERAAARALHPRQTLEHALRKGFDDERLRQLAAYPVTRTGRRPVDEPAFRSVESYLDRTFGVWRAPRGAADLASALLTRMTERSVDVRFDAEVTTVLLAAGRVSGVEVPGTAPVRADIVVTTQSPHRVFGTLLDRSAAPAAGRLVAPSPRTRPRSTTYLGLTDAAPALPAEVVLHGDPLLVLSTDGSTADGQGSAWTVVSHGLLAADLLDVMAARGVDVRRTVTTRLAGADTGTANDRSTYPLGWAGARTARARAVLTTPLPGLYCLGTGLVLGPSVPYVAWQAAHVAELVGKA